MAQDKPEDFVIATGVQYSVRDFVDAATKELGITIRWEGAGLETLPGDPGKAREKPGWTPKTSFADLVTEMVREDLKAAERDELLKRHGYKAMDCHE